MHHARRRTALRAALTLGAAGLLVAAPLTAQTVRAVMFFSPTCPHCGQVIREDLPIFFQVYGGEPRVVASPPTDGRGPVALLLTNGTLEVLLVDASQRSGGALYEATLVSHPTAPGRAGVPRLIIADSVLVGAVEIPANLHGLIRPGLAGGGIAWPSVPGLDSVLSALIGPADPAGARDAGDTMAVARVGGAPGGRPPPAAGSAPARDAPPRTAEPTAPPAPPSFVDLVADEPPSLRERFERDLAGNVLAVLTLVAMIAVVVAVIGGVPVRGGSRAPGLAFPTLAIVGAAVSAYLTYVETSGTLAVCGPVGDCHTVQNSPYATLFGVPIGALGLVGYGGMAVLWVVARGAAGRTADVARTILLFGTLWGTLFSIYLTFLEPFVIGATCLWCLTSAVVMTALFWLAARWGSVPAT